MSRRLHAFGVFAMLVSGCLKKDNPNYCPGLNPDNNCKEGDAGVPTCTDNAQCSAPAAICDTAANKCVECTPTHASACTGTRPICGADESCRGCISHTECPSSSACLPDGTCASPGEVAYVSIPGGMDNPMCSMAMPCSKIMMALGMNRTYVKLHGSIDESVMIKDRSVTILADPATTLTRSMMGNILTIDGTSSVKIYDLAINGSTGNTNGAGVSLPNGATQTVLLSHVSMSGHNGAAGAISASGGTIGIMQSTISGNSGSGVVVTGGTINIKQSKIFNNAGGGISIASAQFDIENNFITGNGTDTGGMATAYGGISLSQTNSGMRTLSFNTISGNKGAMDITTGVSCSNLVQDLTASSNIVYGNATTGVGTQVGGLHCVWSYSDIGPGVSPVLGSNNMNNDPMLTADFHLKLGSPAINQADPNAMLTIDIDGDARPQDRRCDIGADEYIPPH